MPKKSQRTEIEKEILHFCSVDFKSAREIAEHLGMNLNTARSKYIYSLVGEGKLIRDGRRYRIV
jgi:hypothetical protein